MTHPTAFDAWFDEHYGPDTGSFKEALRAAWDNQHPRRHARSERQQDDGSGRSRNGAGLRGRHG